jgi:hypothetical protein
MNNWSPEQDKQDALKRKSFMSKMPCHITDGPPEDDRYNWDELPDIVAGLDKTPWHVPQPEKERENDRRQKQHPVP